MFFHYVSAELVILVQESDDFEDFRLLRILFCLIRLRGVLVGIAQRRFEVEVGKVAEIAACQADGFRFHDVAAVTLVAEAVEEVVAVAGFEAFFPFGVFHSFAEVELHLQVDRGRVLLCGEERWE